VAQRRPRRSKRSLGGAALGGIALICVALLGLSLLGAFYYYAPRSPTLDAASLCPVSGPDGIVVVLVDTSDDLPEPAKREATRILDDLITGLPPYYKLDIRVLDIVQVRSRSLFSKCNPGDGKGLSEWASNPRLARMRWIENFRKPAVEAVKNSLSSAKANSSPIMAALQDIAIDEFSGTVAEGSEKKLIVISDMLEFTRDYSQYPKAGDLSYQRFRQSPAYLKLRTDLHGAKVTIYYVQRKEPKFDTIQHIEFWHQWVADNRGAWGSAKRLQGVN
jgi:hypothetical protein